jgi:hypothetical protein
MRSSRLQMRMPLLLTAAVLSLSTTAQAIPPYPGDLQSALSLSAAPQCAICHQGGVTGLGTVTTPFGVSMRKYGLTDDASTFPGALMEMEVNKVDSVGRGYSDVQALKMGVDPNLVPANAVPTTPLPATYGCDAQLAPGRVRSPWLWCLALGVALVLRRRTRS